MRVLALAAATFFLAGAASAQTTRCEQTIIGMPQAGVTCHTVGGAPDLPQRAGPAPVYSWKDVKPAPCSRLEIIANHESNMCEARQVAATRKSAGELIAAGKCEEALKVALGTGDLEFAREVRDFCAK